MLFLYISVLFIFGTIFGSFLNVLVVRLKKGETLFGRSHCVHCHKVIPYMYLVPVIGYLFSKTKCFACKKNISPRYIIGEVILGLVYVFIGVSTGLNDPAVLIVSLFLGTLMFYMAYYDILYQEISTSVVLFQLIAIVVLIILTPYTSILFHLAGILIMTPFLLVWIVSRGRLIGFGDILIMSLIGLHLGFILGISAVILAFWVGALVIVGYIIYKKYQGHYSYDALRTRAIPFGPFLVFTWLVTWGLGINIFKIFGII